MRAGDHSSESHHAYSLLRRNRWALLALVLAVMAAGSGVYRWLQLRTAVVTIHVNEIPLRVEVANNPVSRSVGLKNRPTLEPDAGMLFVFPEGQPLKFWMKDTAMDLDIGFFDSDGRLLNVETMTAFDEQTRHRSTAPAKYALEVNHGWFAAHGVPDRAELRLPRALESR